jgi:hypothetical protein
MSDSCRPFAVFRRRLLENDGNNLGKSCRFELFTAKTWSLVWSPGDRRFFPALSSDTLARNEFWETRIRVRIDGRWYRPQGKYQFLARDELAALLLGELLA